MTKVTIEPGICGLTTVVEAVKEGKKGVKLLIKSDCPAISKLGEAFSETLDAYGTCFAKPGNNPFYQYAKEAVFPPHAGCVTIAGIIKCVEVECGLALPKDVKMIFDQE
ncbi:MAG: hypothetical protein RR396_01920 [Clostridiales bacterium]